MSLLSKQDRDLAIEALAFYAGELIIERELSSEFMSEDKLSELQSKIRSVQTLKNWIALDQAKTNLPSG